MDPKDKVGLLKDEYLLLQKLYDDFDTRAITIKGWSATVGLAGIALGFQYTRYLWLVAAGVGATFWILEAIWKTAQYSYEPRIELLEKAFASENFKNVRPFQIYEAWKVAFSNITWTRALIDNTRLGVVIFPHVVTVVAGLILYIANLYLHFQCK